MGLGLGGERNIVFSQRWYRNIIVKWWMGLWRRRGGGRKTGMGRVVKLKRPLPVREDGLLSGHRGELYESELEIDKGAAAFLAKDQQDDHGRPDQSRQPPGKPVGYIG